MTIEAESAQERRRLNLREIRDDGKAGGGVGEELSAARMHRGESVCTRWRSALRLLKDIVEAIEAGG